MHSTLQRLMLAGKIVSCVPQLYYDQTVAVHKERIPVEAFAFYGSPIGLHVDEALVRRGRLRDSVCMSCFGGVDRGNQPEFRSHSNETIWHQLTTRMSWNSFCLAYVKSLGFVSRVVGTTNSSKRMDAIVRYFDAPVSLDDVQGEAVQRVAFDSCRRDHKAPTETKERWEREHRVLRSPLTEMRALAHSIVNSRPMLKKAMNGLRRGL